MRFRSVAHLLRVKNDTRLLNILESISCLVIRAYLSTDNEVSQLIDMVTEVRVAMKYVVVSIPDLSVASLENKTINFNMILYHKEKGNTKLRVPLL